MPDKTKHRVVIGGVRYTLAGDGDAEHLQRVADMVDKHLTDIKKSFGSLPEYMAAVLAACNIADEYLTLVAETKEASDLKIENIRLHEENTMLLKKLAAISNAQNRPNRNK